MVVSRMSTQHAHATLPSSGSCFHPGSLHVAQGEKERLKVVMPGSMYSSILQQAISMGWEAQEVIPVLPGGYLKRYYLAASTPLFSMYFGIFCDCIYSSTSEIRQMADT